jgi:DNA modification methylase
VTKKENVVARTFIDVELKELLEIYLPTLDPKNPFLFQNKQGKCLSEKRIDEILKQLFEKAGLKTQKVLRWHTFRKLVLRTSAELGLNQWSARILVGKSVPSDIMTYISGLNLKEDFLRLSAVLKLKSNGNGNGKVKLIEETLLTLEKENAALKKENVTLKQRIEILQKNFEGMQKTLGDYEERLVWLEKKTGKKERVPID